MGHLERGEKNLSFRSIVRIATALDVTLLQLFSGVDGAGLEVAPVAVSGQRAPASNADSHLDRTRILKELDALERTVRSLREIATSPKPISTKASKKGARRD